MASYVVGGVRYDGRHGSFPRSHSSMVLVADAKGLHLRVIREKVFVGWDEIRELRVRDERRRTRAQGAPPSVGEQDDRGVFVMSTTLWIDVLCDDEEFSIVIANCEAEDFETELRSRCRGLKMVYVDDVVGAEPDDEGHPRDGEEGWEVAAHEDEDPPPVLGVTEPQGSEDALPSAHEADPLPAIDLLDPERAQAWFQHEFHDAALADVVAGYFGALGVTVETDTIDGLSISLRADALALLSRLALSDGRITRRETALGLGFVAYFAQSMVPDMLSGVDPDDEGVVAVVNGILRELPDGAESYPAHFLGKCIVLDRTYGGLRSKFPLLEERSVAERYMDRLRRLGEYIIDQAGLAGTAAEADLDEYLDRQAASIETFQPVEPEEPNEPLNDWSPSNTGAPPSDERLADLLDELDQLVGLTAVKEQVRTRVNVVRIEQQKRLAGLPVAPQSHHLVFAGNPGTGKTSVARLLSRIDAALGMLGSGHLVEVGRSDLVGAHVGQTAIKTEAVFRSALGGTLFIDEAYSLNRDHDIFGQEAIDTLVRLMEVHRDELQVIVAGYTDEMAEFVESNPGLASRFRTTVEFPDYTDEELVAIFHRFCSDNGVVVDEWAEVQLWATVAALHRGDDFGNARTVRNLFERAVANQANRLVELSDSSGGAPLTVEQLSTLEAVDVVQQV